MSKVLVISPSGNLYGSEQVLLDYLKCTQNHFDLMLPAKSEFSLLAVQQLKKHTILHFNNKKAKWFYLGLFFQLLAGKYNTVYSNEAAHSRYILLLAKFFRRRRFVIHVRIAEDTIPARWKLFSAANTRLIAISKNIEEQLGYKSILLYDLYMFSESPSTAHVTVHPGTVTVGIIGRLARSKGLYELGALLSYISQYRPNSRFRFKLFGDIPAEVAEHPVVAQLKQDNAISFMGFISSKTSIYKSIDIVLHMSKTEPLGRIFLEAIDEQKPFVGFNSAGIGEIGKLTGLDELLCDPNNENCSEDIFGKLEAVGNDYSVYVAKVLAQKKQAAAIFSAAVYTEKMDKILTE